VEKSCQEVQAVGFFQVVENAEKIKALIEMANQTLPYQQLATFENRWFLNLAKLVNHSELLDRKPETPIAI
jgi:hypothetical protein